MEGKTGAYCNNICDLPYSILIKIFSFLSLEDRLLDACLVCKLWHSICFDEIFWRDIDFEDRRLVSNKILKRSVVYSENVTSLNLCDCYSKILTRKGIAEATALCPNLKTLNIKNSSSLNVGDDILVEICRNCPRLETFIVHAQSITDRAITEGVAKYLKPLRHLNIEQNNGITDEGMFALLSNCPNLSTLRLDLLDRVTDEFLKKLGARERERARITELSLSMTGITGRGTWPVQYLTSLTCLDITRCKDLDHADVYVIVSRVTKLKELHMGMTDSVDDRCVKAVVMYLKDLEHLDVASTSITDVSMEHLAANTKKLRRLDMAYTKVTHKGVQAVCEDIPSLRYLGLLRCDSADENELELLGQRHPSIYFSTFLQDAKRMLIRSGRWDEADNGIVTHEMIFTRLRLSCPDVPTKPKRIIGTGGKIMYVPHDLVCKNVAPDCPDDDSPEEDSEDLICSKPSSEKESGDGIKSDR